VNALSKPLTATLFKSVEQPKGSLKKVSLREFADIMVTVNANGKDADAAKALLPLLAFGRFKNNYRNDQNVIECSAIIGDYDGEQLSMEDAAEMLRKVGVAALFYTSPRHRPSKPRWRVIVVLRDSCTGDEHVRYVARLNGALGGVLAGESFTRSQCYYFGGVNGRPPKVILVNGEYFDDCDDLDAGAIGKIEAPREKTKPKGGEDRSTALFALACEYQRDGKTLKQFNAAWPDNEVAAAHVAADPKGKKRTAEQRQRAVKRAWKNASHTVGDEGEHILLMASELNPNLEKLDRAMKAAHERDVFQRSGRVVFIRAEVEGVRDGKKIWAPLIIEMNAQQVQQEAMRAIRFRKIDAKSGMSVSTECPEKFASHYLNMTEWRLPHLFGIVSHPTLRNDGSIVEAEGFDEKTGVFYAPGIKFPRIPETPTSRDVACAVDALRDVVRGFDFADDAAFAVYLASLMSTVVRPALPSAPIYGFDAPLVGSGKTKLATSVSLIARGETVETMNQAPTPEEEEKRLFAALRVGKRFVLIDNCTRPLDGEHLCAISTSPKWGSRVLGKSENQSFPTAVTIMATGNNLVFRGDLASRAFVCRLTPKVANPRERKFEWSFEDECLNQRPALVAAALTIIRAYLAGKQTIEPRTRFPDWDRMVRQPLIAAGLPDVCSTMHEEEEDDRDNTTLRTLLKTWRAALADSPVRLKQLARRAENAGPQGAKLIDMLGKIAPEHEDGPFDADRLGKWLREHRDMFTGGLVLRCQTDPNNGARWHVAADLRG
jgi:hypothetical protein